MTERIGKVNTREPVPLLTDACVILLELAGTRV